MKKQYLRRIGLCVWFCVLLLLSAVSNPVWAADITGDGISDLIIGVPEEDIGDDIYNGGAVATIRGAKGVGLTGDDQLIFQDDAQEINEDGDTFGSVLSVGDYDGDGIYDAAVGVPKEDWSDLVDPGCVQVIYGKIDVGLDGNQVDFITQNDFTSIGFPAESYDEFGSSLASGDFDGDGYDDLSISVPYETLRIESIDHVLAGIVHVIYGSWEGLDFDFTQSFYQNFLSGGEVTESGDYFGRALTAGDFNHDGKDDLVIGVPGEDLNYPGVVEDAGAVHIIYGHRNGLGAGGSELIHQDFEASGDQIPEIGDRFGEALGTGDFDGDGYDDLVVGMAWENIGAASDAGAVQVFYGDNTGIDYEGNRWITQLYVGSSEANDRFGFSLAVGDFDGNNCDDLAVGVPREAPPTIVQAGEVDIFYGYPQSYGLDPVGYIFNQGGANGGAQEEYDQFGYSLAVGNFNGDRYDDLVVGVPFEDYGQAPDAGVIHVYYGAYPRLTNVGYQIWHQDSGPINDSAEAGDLFGMSLAAIPGIFLEIYLPVIVK